MQLPLQVTFHGISPSSTVASYVEKKAHKLDKQYGGIMRCRVTVEAPHRHSREGRRYAVRIDLTISGEEIAISRDLGDSETDTYAAIDEAFDEAKRRLRDTVDVLRGDVKSHEHALHGRVSKLFTYEGYGFIERENGDEVYFHRNAVLNHAFDRLVRGSHVRFIEEEGDDGIHATSVTLVGSRHG
jgi:ribosomal subunit interface protein